MKTLIKGIAQTIVLDQTGLGAGKTIKLSIIGENGDYILDSANAEIKDQSLTYNSTPAKYEITLTIKESQDNQYIRVYFYSSNATIQSKYYPEDYKLDSQVFTPIGEIIPITYFEDYFLKLRGSIDVGLSESINNYLQDRDGLRSMLISSENDLELDAELFFQEREISEERDNYFEFFNGNFWQFQVSHPPINKLLDFKLKFGGNEIANIGLDLFTVTEKMGLIEFMPIPTDSTSGLYSLLMHSLSGVGIAILTGGLYERIPCMFHVNYKTGIWNNADRQLKEGIRTAIARRCFVKLIDFLDPAGRMNSESESIDGVSSSVSYNSDKLVDRLNKEEQKFINNLKRRFGRDADLIVI